MKQRAFKEPEFYNKFTPCFENLKTLIESYQIGIIEWGNQHIKDRDTLKRNLEYLNNKNKTGNVTGMEWQQYDRELEHLEMQKESKRRSAIKLKGLIEMEINDFYGMFPRFRMILPGIT